MFPKCFQNVSILLFCTLTIISIFKKVVKVLSLLPVTTFFGNAYPEFGNTWKRVSKMFPSVSKMFPSVSKMFPKCFHPFPKCFQNLKIYKV